MRSAWATARRAGVVVGAWLAAQIAKIWARVHSGDERDSTPSLLPLTPRYNPEKHRVYLEAIDEALRAPREPVLNIALTGSYGVGKSSILQEVARRHKRKLISISLSSLGLPEQQPTSESGQASTKTNRIQKEIVKQLLYGEDPVKMPGSRYRRVTRFRFWRELGLASLLAVPLTVMFYLTGWSGSLAKLIPLPTHWDLLIHVIVFAALTALILGFRMVTHNRIQIDKISAGSATISLSAKSATYFDEYLDEIVYFFEMIRRDIVVFEDIDRFDDAHIFETLRSLNSILNGAKQLRGRRIRFVYAIKDSIFDELGVRAAAEEIKDTGEDAAKPRIDDAAVAEIARANRTKFFDLVIPVVPFITHRSARDLFVSTMKDVDHAVSNELIDLAARHVADMRLIKNIRNEFAIFKQLVIDTGDLDLNQDKLFAMMLYKSTHLSDFELIKLGKSNLDELYKDGRALVRANVSTLNQTMRVARSNLANVAISADHSATLGPWLTTHIKARLFEVGANGIQSYSLNNESVDQAAFVTPAFWETLASSDGKLTISYVQRSGYAASLDLTRAEIEEAVGEAVSSTEWANAERTRLDQQIVDARVSRDFLIHADMAALASRAEFTLTRDGKEKSFASLVKDRLKSELASQLLTAGYIDRNFTLYTSTFYGERISANATNFILKNVDPNDMDIFFPLTEDDVNAIIREKGVAILRERSAYNIALLDHLLAHAPRSAETLADRIMVYGEDEQEFLQAYFENGTHRDALVRYLAARWQRVLVVLIDTQLDEQIVRQLVNVALENLSESIEFVATSAVRDYLLHQTINLDAFTSEDITAQQAALIAKLVKQTGGRLANLKPLGSHVRSAVVADGSYELTRENLLIALGKPDSSLSLDRIAEADAAIHARVLSDLPEYLALLHDGEPTVIDKTTFIATITKVAAAGEALLPAIIARANRDCAIDDLTKVPVAAWHALAEERRFPATFTNVQAYLQQVGMDEALGGLISETGAIKIVGNPDEPAKLDVALAILRAKDRVASPKLRARLVESLSLEQYITPQSIPTEPGELFGWLIENDIVDDSASTFAAIPSSDTSGLCFAISKSKEFPSFMSATQVTPINVAALVESAVVPVVVKDAIAQRFAEFTAGATKSVLSVIAQYARDREIVLDFEQVLRLATERVESGIVVDLLQPHLPSLELDGLIQVMNALGGRYADLTEPNGRRPQIPNTAADRALINRMKELGVVSTVSEQGAYLRVNMRQR